jgi:hypothetical protein
VVAAVAEVACQPVLEKAGMAVVEITLTVGVAAMAGCLAVVVEVAVEALIIRIITIMAAMAAMEKDRAA